MVAEGKSNSFELQQIIGLAAQQVQLLRGIKDTASVAGATKSAYLNTSVNPFAGAAQGEGYNPFSTGASHSQKGFFGMPSFAQLGTGVAAQLVESKLGSTDISVLSTGSPRSSLVSSFGFFNNKSKVNQDARMMASANLADKTTSGLLSGAGMALNIFAGSNPYTMAAALAFNIGADQMKQQNAYNKYMLQNSYKFINFSESTNKSGMAGFGLDDRMNMASYLRHFGNRKRISDTDTMDIFSGLAEGGLLRNSSNIDDVKKRMSEYTDIIKKMAAATGETYKSMVGLMADLKKMGIDPSKADEYTSTMKALQNMTGADYRTISNNISSMASSLTQNSAISAGNVVDSLSDKYLLSNALYDSVSKKAETGDASAKRTLSLISNLGGPEQAFAQVAGIEKELLSSNQAGMEWLGLNFFDYDDNTGTWKFNQNSYNNIMSGGTNYNELISKATAKANTLDNVQKNSWLQNGAEYMMSNMDSAESSAYIKSILNSLQSNAGYGERKMTTEEQLSLLMGMNSASAKLYGAQLDFANTEEGRNAIGQGKAAIASEKIVDRLNSNAVGVGYKIKTGWNEVKDYVGDGVSPINAGINSAAEGIGNWWNGYKFDKINFGGSKEWDYLQTNSLEDAIGNLSKKFDEVADSSDKLAQKYKDVAPSLSKLSDTIKSSNNKIQNASGISYAAGDNNTMGIVSIAMKNQNEHRKWNILDNYGSRQEVSAADQKETRDTYIKYLGLNDNDVIDTGTVSDVGYQGSKKYKELMGHILNKDSSWTSKSIEDKMQDIGFLYSFENSNADYLSLSDRRNLNKILIADDDGSATVTNPKYLADNNGEGIDFFDYASGGKSSTKLSGKHIAKQVEKYKKDINKLEKQRGKRSANGTWADADEKAYVEKVNQYNDIVNAQDSAKAMAQDTYAIFGQVLSQDQLKDIGLDWGKIKAGKFSDDDLSGVYTAGINKIAGLTASQIGKEGSGRMSSDLVEFFSSAGISVDDLRANANDTEYLQNAVKQGLDNVWSGMVAGTPEEKNTKSLDDNTEALKDNTIAIRAQHNKGAYKDQLKDIDDKYSNPAYIK